jgi:electron transport complex protein RnfG
MDKKSWAIPLTLAAMTLITSSLLYFSERATHDKIEEQKRQKLLQSLQTIAPAALYDNDLLATAHDLFAPEALGHRQPRQFYRGYKQGKLSLVILPVTARKGYSGDIRLLVAIAPASGTIVGTRILEHHETPGLGDQIEPEKSPWLQQFLGKSLGQPPENQWKVRKDGGAFDQITGATISPRAVVVGLRKALQYARLHQQEWQKMPSPTAGSNTDITQPGTQPKANH